MLVAYICDTSTPSYTSVYCRCKELPALCQPLVRAGGFQRGHQIGGSTVLASWRSPATSAGPPGFLDLACCPHPEGICRARRCESEFRRPSRALPRLPVPRARNYRGCPACACRAPLRSVRVRPNPIRGLRPVPARPLESLAWSSHDSPRKLAPSLPERHTACLAHFLQRLLPLRRLVAVRAVQPAHRDYSPNCDTSPGLCRPQPSMRIPPIARHQPGMRAG